MEQTAMDSSPAIEPLPLEAIKQDLIRVYVESSARGLVHSAHWSIELANSIEVKCTQMPSMIELSGDEVTEASQLMLGKSLYDTREYRRAASSLEKCNSTKATFLRLYALYMAGEKNKEDNLVDAIGEDEVQDIKNEEMVAVKEELTTLANNGTLDSYGHYLFGIICKEQKLLTEAREKFVKSCQLCPTFWGSWQELSRLCDDRKMLEGLPLPDHWMKKFYIANGYMELLHFEDAMSLYTSMVQQGLGHSPYVVSQIALAHYHLSYFQPSIDAFQHLEKLDPYQLDNVDTYSNVLFVKGNKVELTLLAERATEIDRYRPETLCALGNLYTLRGEHENAVTHFKLATRIDRSSLSAWILLGHSYVELRNPTLAIEAYTRALAINKRDFRGHYGLGQAYEILKMPHMAMYFYKSAHTLRPNDGRFLRALSDCYLELNCPEEAKKCLKCAVSLGDNEGESILMLAKLHEHDKEHGEAAKLYTKYLTVASTVGTTGNLEEQYHVHLFMSRHHLRQGNYKEAEVHAHQACQFDVTREKGKSLLREIYKRHGSIDSTVGKGIAAADLSGLELDISPISLFQEQTQ
ncbi:cell division cycle protein 23 homolog [Dysidea avara]|uniref:cell division cycle protein 23 homolog n=1 Tax=Dysidea avara TaxID=196820 RepID=UPI00332AF05E